MVTLENIDGLKNFLRHDKGQKTFSPVRFINVDSLSDWFEMKNFLGTLTTNFIFLSEYCAADDTFPNLRKLRNDLQKENRSVCVLPLSEILRVSPDRAAQEINFFRSVRKGEASSSRIYFLMYRLRSFFLSLKIADPREKNCVLLSPADESDDYSLTIIQKFMRLKISGKRVDGFKQYLKYWETSPNAALNLYTENAVHLQDKKFFDDVKVIANAFDLLRHHYALPAALKKNFSGARKIGNSWPSWSRALEISTKLFARNSKSTGSGTARSKISVDRKNFDSGSCGFGARCKVPVMQRGAQRHPTPPKNSSHRFTS